MCCSYVYQTGVEYGGQIWRTLAMAFACRPALLMQRPKLPAVICKCVSVARAGAPRTAWPAHPVLVVVDVEALVRVDVDLRVVLGLLRRRPHKTPDRQVIDEQLIPVAHRPCSRTGKHAHCFTCMERKAYLLLILSTSHKNTSPSLALWKGGDSNFSQGNINFTTSDAGRGVQALHAGDYISGNMHLPDIGRRQTARQ